MKRYIILAAAALAVAVIAALLLKLSAPDEYQRKSEALAAQDLAPIPPAITPPPAITGDSISASEAAAAYDEAPFILDTPAATDGDDASPN